MFSVQALLPRSESPEVWAEKLVQFLASSETSSDFTLTESELPFGGGRQFMLNWGEWTMTVHPGQESSDRSGEPSSLRVVFGSDPSLDFTNHMIWVQEFLQAIPGALYRENT